jgi:hypothetical protein
MRCKWTLWTVFSYFDRVFEKRDIVISKTPALSKVKQLLKFKVRKIRGIFTVLCYEQVVSVHETLPSPARPNHLARLHQWPIGC